MAASVDVVSAQAFWRVASAKQLERQCDSALHFPTSRATREALRLTQLTSVSCSCGKGTYVTASPYAAPAAQQRLVTGVPGIVRCVLRRHGGGGGRHLQPGAAGARVPGAG